MKFKSLTTSAVSTVKYGFNNTNPIHRSPKSPPFLTRKKTPLFHIPIPASILKFDSSMLAQGRKEIRGSSFSIEEFVTQFQSATSEETKEKTVANLANFAYDP